METNLIYPEESYAIRGAVFEVYREIGCGFAEAVYQDCLQREFRLRLIPFEPQKRLQLYYKNELIEPIYIADFVCYNKIIVELKAVSETNSAHTAQVLNYLKMTKFQLGLLVNFGHYPKATIQRLLNKDKTTEHAE
jgi:GxxExxY protein